MTSTAYGNERIWRMLKNSTYIREIWTEQILSIRHTISLLLAKNCKLLYIIFGLVYTNVLNNYIIFASYHFVGLVISHPLETCCLYKFPSERTISGIAIDTDLKWRKSCRFAPKIPVKKRASLGKSVAIRLAITWV